MTFFSVKRTFEGNLSSKYVVKVFLAGITILGRRDWTIKPMSEMPLRVQPPLTGVPQAYELIILNDECANVFWQGLVLFCRSVFAREERAWSLWPLWYRRGANYPHPPFSSFLRSPKCHFKRQRPLNTPSDHKRWPVQYLNKYSRAFAKTIFTYYLKTTV